MAAPEPLLTTYTVGNGTPVEMAAKAASYSEARAIKIKLGGNADDESRIAAGRAARPDVWHALDANPSQNPTSPRLRLPATTHAHGKLQQPPSADAHDAGSA